MCGVTRMGGIRNEYIIGSLKVAPIIDKLRFHRLAWYGHVMGRYVSDHESIKYERWGMEVTRFFAQVKVDEVCERRYEEQGSDEMASDLWKKRICANAAPTPRKSDNGKDDDNFT
jgi:hypothetical protein